MKPETQKAIKESLKLIGGRSRPDKSFPFIEPLLESIAMLNYKPAILDVGCGRGSFSSIINAEFPDRFIMDAVEIHNQYLNSIPLKFYRKIYVEDYTETYKNHLGYDVYLFVDIIEHFERDVAIEIIKFLTHQKASNAKIIASIPNASKHWHQAETFEKANPHEAHRHNWTNDEVKKELGLKLIGDFDAIGVFVS